MRASLSGPVFIMLVRHAAGAGALARAQRADIGVGTKCVEAIGVHPRRI